jgi:hypothetical protein
MPCYPVLSKPLRRGIVRVVAGMLAVLIGSGVGIATAGTSSGTANAVVSSSITVSDLTSAFTLTGAPGVTPTAATPVMMNLAPTIVVGSEGYVYASSPGMGVMVGTPVAAVNTGGTTYTRDSSIPKATTGKFFLAGAVFGDPNASTGYSTGTVHTGTTSGQLVLHRNFGTNGTPNATVTQFGNAGKAVGGTTVYDVTSAGDDRCTVTGVALTVPLLSTPSILNGATRAQVRAFLAGVIQGEGSQAGQVADDPSTDHLTVLQQQLLKMRAYVVNTTIDGTTFHHLTVADLAGDTTKLQAYPFASYARAPGGPPLGGSLGSGGVR